ncbi:MAG: glycosyltransferase [Candidatus Woesearchaeota archaeon]
MSLQQTTLWLYNLTLLPIIFFSVLFLLLTLLTMLLPKRKQTFKPLKDFPFVSVQIPSYNDPIAERCIKQCIDFDYPKDKYEIIIVDDSTHEETKKLLKSYADAHPGFIKYIHRENREGFKPGALKNAMSQTKGDIIVIFDADWIPQKDFLKEVVKPFSDPKVAIVQTRQGIYNKDTNWITRFAAYLLMTYHTIIMPLNNRINTVFFCGTAGAIRRSAFEEVGGWNTNSITEDSELSVRILAKGYKSVYLELETPSEVPDTFESFIKQQMRWCYGNARVFFDNAKTILLQKGFSLKQRLMILYITMGNSIAPFVIAMTFFGWAGWFLGDPALFNIKDVVVFAVRFFITAGFLIMGIYTLVKHKLHHEIKYLVVTAFTVGLVLALANSIAFIKAVLNKKLHWFCTPKTANQAIIK